MQLCREKKEVSRHLRNGMYVTYRSLLCHLIRCPANKYTLLKAICFFTYAHISSQTDHVQRQKAAHMDRRTYNQLWLGSIYFVPYSIRV